MKNLVFVLLLAVLGWAPPQARACAWCRPRVEAGIYDAHYGTNALLVLLPVALLLGLGLGVLFWDKRPSLLPFRHGSR